MLHITSGARYHRVTTYSVNLSIARNEEMTTFQSMKLAVYFNEHQRSLPTFYFHSNSAAYSPSNFSVAPLSASPPFNQLLIIFLHPLSLLHCDAFLDIQHVISNVFIFKLRTVSVDVLILCVLRHRDFVVAAPFSFHSPFDLIISSLSIVLHINRPTSSIPLSVFPFQFLSIHCVITPAPQRFDHCGAKQLLS